MRRILVVLALVGLMAVGLGPAQAAVHGADIDTVLVSGGQVVSIRGTIRCDAGDSFALRVNIRDADGSTAIGKAGGTCTGSPQTWVTSEEQTFGSFACSGPVAGHMQARSGGDSQSFSDRAQLTCP